jgi:hypothetical protein
MTIPASSIHFNGDGTAWWVLANDAWIGDRSAGALLSDNDRPCVTCGGSGEAMLTNLGWAFRDDHEHNCPDCDGTGRPAFTVEVPTATAAQVLAGPYIPGPRSLRVSIREGMVLPIKGGKPNTPMWQEGERLIHMMKNSAFVIRARGGGWLAKGVEQVITLPPDARPGMWAVLLDIHEGAAK